MTITKFLIYLITITLLFGCKPEVKKGADKTAHKGPNVVFIAVDDLRPELGIYGNDVVQTPNMDKLANQGAYFTHHYVQVPTCGASRYSLMTGMRPRKPGHLSNEVFAKEVADSPENPIPESFVHQLKRNGYYTVGIGKISHAADGLVYGYEEKPTKKMELPHSWNEFHFNSGKWQTGWNAFFAYANGENRQSMKRQVKPYEAGKVEDTGYPDGLTAELAVAKLKELKAKKKPFFLGVGFFKPHLPFNAPKKYWDLYNENDIPLASNGAIPEYVNRASLHNSGELNGYQLTDEVASLNNKLSDAYSKKLTHAYYAAVSYVDAQIGKVIKEITNLGLEDDTIIVLWGDHGWHLGNQLVWGKHTLFETALRSTLIVKVPGLKSKGAIDNIVETVDIYPTILALCNIETPEGIDGESFLPTLKGEQLMRNNDVAYSYFRKGISMRTNRYRLTKYYREEMPVVELYDHQTDPYETINIAQERMSVVDSLMPLFEKGNTNLYKVPKEL